MDDLRAPCFTTPSAPIEETRHYQWRAEYSSSKAGTAHLFSNQAHHAHSPGFTGLCGSRFTASNKVSRGNEFCGACAATYRTLAAEIARKDHAYLAELREEAQRRIAEVELWLDEAVRGFERKVHGGAEPNEGVEDLRLRCAKARENAWAHHRVLGYLGGDEHLRESEVALLYEVQESFRPRADAIEQYLRQLQAECIERDVPRTWRLMEVLAKDPPSLLCYGGETIGTREEALSWARSTARDYHLVDARVEVTIRVQCDETDEEEDVALVCGRHVDSRPLSFWYEWMTSLYRVEEEAQTLIVLPRDSRGQLVARVETQEEARFAMHLHHFLGDGDFLVSEPQWAVVYRHLSEHIQHVESTHRTLVEARAQEKKREAELSEGSVWEDVWVARRSAVGWRDLDDFKVYHR